MALTSAQKHSIIFHLGYPAKSIIPDTTDFSQILADKLDGLTADVEAIVVSLLDDLDAVRLKMIAGQDIVKAKRVGDIELNNDEIKVLRSEYRRILRELGRLLDITPIIGGGQNVAVCL